MKPGDHVIWLHSPARSFLTGWVYRRRIRIRVRLKGREKLLNVRQDNVISDEDG